MPVSPGCHAWFRRRPLASRWPGLSRIATRHVCGVQRPRACALVGRLPVAYGSAMLRSVLASRLGPLLSNLQKIWITTGAGERVRRLTRGRYLDSSRSGFRGRCAPGRRLNSRRTDTGRRFRHASPIHSDTVTPSACAAASIAAHQSAGCVMFRRSHSAIAHLASSGICRTNSAHVLALLDTVRAKLSAAHV